MRLYPPLTLFPPYTCRIDVLGQAVKTLLEPFGQVEEIVIPRTWKRASKECRTGCFARFVFRDDAINAYQVIPDVPGKLEYLLMPDSPLL